MLGTHSQLIMQLISYKQRKGENQVGQNPLQKRDNANHIQVRNKVLVSIPIPLRTKSIMRIQPITPHRWKNERLCSPPQLIISYQEW